MYKSEDCVVCEVGFVQSGGLSFFPAFANRPSALQDVSAEGVLSGGGCHAAKNAETYFGSPEDYDGYLATVEKGFDQTMLIYGSPAGGAGAPYTNSYSAKFRESTTDVASANGNLWGNLNEATGTDASSPDADTLPFVIFQGSSYASNDPTVPKCVNRGHLGCLDAPDKAKRLQGGSFYQDRPTLVKVAGTL